jgi:hypothetical protein
MSLFGSKKEKTSVVLIDIDSSSVGGALAHLADDEQPIIYYTARQVIEQLEHEDQSQAMLRTLTELANDLVTKGAPTLRKETGSGHINKILVSIGAPWQKTTVRSEILQEQKHFVFTKALLNEIIQKEKEVPKGYSKSSETVIATLLNGYEISQPFGKKATRAELIILSSLLDTNVAKAVENSLRKTYHTHALTMTAFAPAAYAVFRDVYPHEKDFLVLDISGNATDLVSVKHGMLVNVATIPHGIQELVADSILAGKSVSSGSPLLDPACNARFSLQMQKAEKAWLKNVEVALQEFAAGHALPRTVFMLADTDAHEYLKHLLDTPDMRNLWLTTEPLRVIPVVSSHLASLLKMRGGEADGDVSLEILALYARHVGNV